MLVVAKDLVLAAVVEDRQRCAVLVNRVDRISAALDIRLAPASFPRETLLKGRPDRMVSQVKAASSRERRSVAASRMLSAIGIPL
jgi:hypothetical protein